MNDASTASRVYELLTSDDDGRVCKEIPESACNAQPRNFLIHVLSLGASKTADGLSDPKLILSWLMSSLGAPAYLIGLLVPIREAGALLPQLFIATKIREQAKRKWVWSLGSVGQGLSVLLMAGAALWLDGARAGWAIVAALIVFSLSRSACSVSYKDVLGKTVLKASRGTATGSASTLSSLATLSFGILLSIGLIEKSTSMIAAILVCSGALCLVAAILFSMLSENAGATEGGGNPIAVAREQWSLLFKDKQLSRFIITRSFLIPTALAPPYILALAGRDGGYQLGDLGRFMIASALAAAVSTYIWGRLSDVSSRKVLAISAAAATVVLASTCLTAWASPAAINGDFTAPALLFALMISYQGVRLGRSTHIVDMADEDTRATYTALSNTIVGIFLLAGGLFGLVSQALGETVVLALFACLTLLAVFSALGLEEVQDR